MTRIYFHLKRGPFPFSDQDCRYMSLVRKKYGKDEAGELAWLAGRGITRDKYDIWLYFPSAVSGDMPVHQALLKRSPFNIVGLVAHEDWHMTVGLPLHLEEASAALIEIAAPVLFGYSRERSLKEFARWSKCVVAINLCHKEISAMAVQLENKEITYEQYLARREQCVRVAEKSQDCYPELNPTKVAHLHTYTYYFPLLYRLYNACGCDLLKFIEVLKEMDKHGNFTTPRSFISKEQFFLGWREAEMQAEAYLENVIKILSVDKSK